MIRLSCHKRCLCLLRSYITFPIRAIGRKHFVPMRGVFLCQYTFGCVGEICIGVYGCTGKFYRTGLLVRTDW